MPLLGILLPLILGPLVKVAEKKLTGESGEVKKGWVLEMLNDLWEIAAHRIPFLGKFEGVKQAGLEYAAEKIDQKVQKLKAKDKL